MKLIYQVLSTGKPYVEHGAPPLDERQKQRLIRHHARRLGKLGIAVYSTRPAATGGVGLILKPAPEA